MKIETKTQDARKLADAVSYDMSASAFDDLTERYSAGIASLMVGRALLDANDVLLDLGTGTGLVALLAAQRMTPCEVIGIDHSDGMLDQARAKARTQGLAERVSFRVMDAEALDFSDAHFNAVLSLFVLRHLPNPQRAIEEMYRVLKPGGRVVLSVGARPPLMSRAGAVAGARLVADKLLAFADMRATSPTHLRSFLAEKGVPFASSQAAHEHLGDVASMLRTAGFSHVSQDWCGQQYSLEPVDFWDVQAVFDSQARTMLGPLEDDSIASIKKDYLAKLEKIRARGGGLIYRTGAMVYTAHR